MSLEILKLNLRSFFLLLLLKYIYIIVLIRQLYMRMSKQMSERTYIHTRKLTDGIKSSFNRSITLVVER